MKYIIILVAGWLLYGGTAFCQTKINPDSTGVPGRERISSLQWSRKLKDGKSVYYMFDAKSNKTYPIYTAQLANYVFLSKEEAQNTYLSISNGVGIPYLNGSTANYLQPTAAATGSTLVTRDANGKSSFQGLEVAGMVHTKEVLVNLDGFSDYVFDKDYKLPELNEVKIYVDKHHHLPDMPSEKDVMTKGLNLGEVTNILTKKVEELTLYLIKQETAFKMQMTNNRILQNQIDHLNAKLNNK